MQPPVSTSRALLLAVGLAFCVGAAAVAQDDGAPLWRTFTRGDGLAANDVRTLYEDSDGGIWFATGDGVTRFDGLWATFTQRDGLLSDNVRAVVEEIPGIVWVATDVGVDRLVRDLDGEWAPSPLGTGTLHADVGGLVAAPDGATPSVWAASADGLYRWTGRAWAMYGPLAGVPVRLVVADAADGLWCVVEGTAEGGPALVHVSTFDTPPDGFLLPGPAATRTVNDMLPLGAGQWWLGTSQGILYFDNGRWVVLDFPPGAPRVNGLSRHAVGTIWAATDVGLYELAGAWEVFGAADGLPSDIVRDVLVDAQERLWVATPNGVAMDDDGWHAFAAPTVTALAADLSDAVWVGTDAGLDRVDDAGRQTFGAGHGLPEGAVGAVAVAPDNAVWVGTAGVHPGLARGVGGVWESVRLPAGSGRVHAIAFDSIGRPWVGTGFLELDGDAVRVDTLGAAAVLDKGAWQTFDLPGTPVSIAEDGEGGMWAATRTHGAFRIADGGALPDVSLPQDARALLADAGGRLWLATSEGILRRLDDGWSDTLIPGVSATRGAWSVFEDNAGAVWAGVGDGIARRDPSGHWAPFGAADGIPQGGIGEIAQTTDGALWFASRSGNGLLRRSVGRAFPQTRLSSPPRGDIGESAIRLDFAGGAARTPVDLLRFSYRVNGGPWSAPRAGTSEVVTGLPNGQEAVIQVRAVDRDGTADPTPATTVVRVDTTPPLAAITHPQQGDHIRGSVEIRGTAWDETDFEVYTVELPEADPVESADRVSDDILAVWHTGGLSDGRHVVRLTVRDRVTGAHDITHVQAREVAVTVDNTQPEAVLSVPDGVVSGAVEMHVGAGDAGLASWRLEHAREHPSGTTDWVTIRERAAAGTLVDEAVTWEASGVHGATRLRLRVVDRAGNSVDVTRNIVLDHPDALPVVTIDEPRDGAVVRGSVQLAGTVADATLDSYTVSIERPDGSSEILRAASEPVVDDVIADWDTRALVDGDFTIVVEARDSNTYRSEVRVRVTVDNTPAVVEIKQPRDGAILAFGREVNIRASVQDLHAREFRVEYAADEDAPEESWTQIQEGVVSGGFADAVWIPDGAIARPYVRVVVVDEAAHRGASIAVRVLVDAGPPIVSIEEPADSAIVTGSVVVRGSVADESLDHYTVSYRAGLDADTIHSPGDAAPPGALAVWHTPIMDGPATLRVFAVDAVGFDAEATSSVRVDNLDPKASITEPSAGAQVAGVVDLVGSADDAHFVGYTMDWTPAGDGSPDQWTPITQDVATPVASGRLATWDTGVAEGPVRVRLVATDAAGHAAVAERVFVVAGTLRGDRHAIMSATDGAVVLRLPPNALPDSTSITLNAASAKSVMGRRPLYVVRVDPEGIVLDARKPGALEFRLPPDRETGAVGVAQWDATRGVWRYLGGTVDDDAGWVRTRVFRLGSYALIPEPSAFAAPSVELRLRCQPRAFSPLGGELPQLAFVTFSLRETARARIRVYNQAGRLARRLADTQLGPGEHALPWDGRDDMGRVLPNGAYVVQVDCGYAQERQVVLIWDR